MEHKKRLDFSKIDMTKVKKRLLQLGLSSLMVASLTACSGPKDDNYKNVPQTTIETLSNIPEQEEIVTSIEEIKEEPKQETKEDEKPIVVIEEHQDEEQVFVPNFVFLDYENGYEPEGSTYKDLKHVTKAVVMIIGSSNPKEEYYDFLNYIPNIEEIEFLFYDSSNINLRNVVDFSRFPNMKKVYFNSHSQALNSSTLSFLKDFKHIDNLEFGESANIYIGEVNADNLILSTSYKGISFDDLSKFKSIEIDMSPYDSAIFFTQKIISDLRSKGVNITVKDEESFNQVDDKLNSIIEDLKITPNDTEEEKIRKIVTRIMEMCQYDPETKKNDNGGERFYKEGALYPVLEGETQICGNYASITSALGNRAGLEVYTLEAPKHAFNLIKIGDYYYSLDVTWLDEEHYIEQIDEPLYSDDGEFINSVTYKAHSILDAFQQNDYETIYSSDGSYLFDPTRPYTDPNESVSHQPYGLPRDIELTEIPDDQEIKNVLLSMILSEASKIEQIEVQSEEPVEEVTEQEESIPDLTNKEFKVKINGKLVIIPAAVLVGLLVGLGVAKRKQQAKTNRRRHTIDDYDSYSSSYDSLHNSSRRRK